MWNRSENPFRKGRKQLEKKKLEQIRSNPELEKNIGMYSLIIPGS